MLCDNKHESAKKTSRKKRTHKLLNLRVPGDITSQGVKHYFELLDCPRALTCWLMFDNNEHDQLVELECNPNSYDSSEEFVHAYRATEFLSKATFLNLARDTEAVAIKKFHECEAACKHVNTRFKNLAIDPLYKGPIVYLHDAVKRKISSILGGFSVQEMFDLAYWGPGATTLIKRDSACAANKFQSESGITRDLFNLIAVPLDSYSFTWSDMLVCNGYPNFQASCKIVTVPKNAKTDRIIAIEPGMNSWFQLGIGQSIVRRLSRVGVDLSDQSVNQEHARTSSLRNDLATIDFSSASDTISKSVVEALLPPRWFSVMDSCRSHYGARNSLPLLLEKFSSMGNGFTFPLQTLIFYSMAYAVLEYLGIQEEKAKLINAYGDDVVIPVECFELFSDLSDFYGLQLNLRKSYYFGYFRESCGCHYYSGVDAKPFYLRDKLVKVIDVYLFANSIRRSRPNKSQSVRRLWHFLVQSVPKSLRFKIPDGFGDGGFISTFDDATPPIARRGFEGFRFMCLSEVSIGNPFQGPGPVMASLWNLHRRSLFQGRNEPEYTTRFSRLLILRKEHNRPSEWDYVFRRSFTKIRRGVFIAPQWRDPPPL
jgi:hypothetical protein